VCALAFVQCVLIVVVVAIVVITATTVVAVVIAVTALPFCKVSRAFSTNRQCGSRRSCCRRSSPC